MTTPTKPVAASSFATADDSFVVPYLQDFWQAVGGAPAALAHVSTTGEGALPCAFPFTDFAAAAISTASLAVAELVATQTGGRLPDVSVDRRLASFWFQMSLRPQGWSLPPVWDPIAGDYLAADGWIRLHTNAPHHRDAALSVLGTAIDRDAVTRAVAGWQANELEAAVVEAGGVAAAMRTQQAWAEHPQGRAVATEPLLHWQTWDANVRSTWRPSVERPLHGVRVLDLTRILAGPTATRFLAGFGADVLRIDPYGWEEPGTVPEVVLGKRCARLDLKHAGDRAILERLLREADVLVHGYRPDALTRLGLGAERRRELNPGLIDVSLDAYGWTGPWHGRRGYDSLVQMSTGVAETGMRVKGTDRPVPLPGQGIDYATGYLMAAAALRGLTQRLASGAGVTVRASLARTALTLVAHRTPENAVPMAPESDADLSRDLEKTFWGPAHRIATPMHIDGTPVRWDFPAGALGTSAPAWR